MMSNLRNVFRLYLTQPFCKYCSRFITFAQYHRKKEKGFFPNIFMLKLQYNTIFGPLAIGSHPIPKVWLWPSVLWRLYVDFLARFYPRCHSWCNHARKVAEDEVIKEEMVVFNIAQAIAFQSTLYDFKPPKVLLHRQLA